MTNHLHDDGLGSKGLSINAFAERHGISVSKIRALCRRGRVIGARKHPLTKKWWIYPPAKLVIS